MFEKLKFWYLCNNYATKTHQLHYISKNHIARQKNVRYYHSRLRNTKAFLRLGIKELFSTDKEKIYIKGKKGHLKKLNYISSAGCF